MPRKFKEQPERGEKWEDIHRPKGELGVFEQLLPVVFFKSSFSPGWRQNHIMKKVLEFFPLCIPHIFPAIDLLLLENNGVKNADIVTNLNETVGHMYGCPYWTKLLVGQPPCFPCTWPYSRWLHNDHDINPRNCLSWTCHDHVMIMSCMYHDVPWLSINESWIPYMITLWHSQCVHFRSSLLHFYWFFFLSINRPDHYSHTLWMFSIQFSFFPPLPPFSLIPKCPL